DHTTVRNITRYGKTLNHYLMTRPSFDNCDAGDGPPCSTEGPGAQFTRPDRGRWRSSESLINQTDLFGSFTTATLKHNYVVGMEFSKEDIYTKLLPPRELSHLMPGSDTDSLYNPNPGRHYSYSLPYGPKTHDGNIKTTSIYAFDTIELNDQFSVN